MTEKYIRSRKASKLQSCKLWDQTSVSCETDRVFGIMFFLINSVIKMIVSERLKLLLANYFSLILITLVSLKQL